MKLKGYFFGLGVYAVCLVPAMLPIFPTTLGLDVSVRLAMVAVVASVLVALTLLTGFDERVGDPGAKFTQALFGIGICAGLYATLVPFSEPQITLMSLLWIAIGMTHLTLRQVLTLGAFFMGIYVNAYSRVLLDTSAVRHADAIYVLLVSLVLCTFMSLRALDYANSHREKADLRDENERQAGELADAKRRIHAITMQDMDTIALKFPFFKEALRSYKERADQSGTSFSIGLIEIDHFSAISARYDEVVVKQILREVVERVGTVMTKLGTEETENGNLPPLGRVGDGLYGMILPRANIKGALACVQQLHKVVELQAIRTMAGLVNITLTIGVAEYFPGESVDEVMEMVGRSLEKARIDNLQDLQPANPPKSKAPPVKLATGFDDLRILHHKEYDSLVH
jgi:diguanylate cyclase (GGDEF)-like protein